MARWLLALGVLHGHVLGIRISESADRLTLANNRLEISIVRKGGYPDVLKLDGVDLLGPMINEAAVPNGPTGSGRSGVGPYLDCHCVREKKGNYLPGTDNATYRVLKGRDAEQDWAGVVMSDTHMESGQIMEQYWFLRDTETGIHSFSRFAYPKDPEGPTRKQLQEFRTLFRPNTKLWTHLSTNDDVDAPLPAKDHIQRGKNVQDETWDLSSFRNDAFVKEYGDYFTKYTFADTWWDHTVHGLFGDGRGNPAGVNGTFGAWMVMRSKDAYYGGPTHGDLTVDGIVYDYMVSNHWGANVPEIKPGFDRTFGPSYYYFNRGAPGSMLQDLRDDATAQHTSQPITSFYESVAQHIPNYVPPSERTSLKVNVKLPPRAKNAVAILSANKIDFQNNAAAPTAAQTWANVDGNGYVEIPSVVPGIYRLTIIADGIFGHYIQDNVHVNTHQVVPPIPLELRESNSGAEVWRIGIPDRSAAEYRHGHERDMGRARRPHHYRTFWGAHNFSSDFPSGVRFRIGESREELDWNYVHWSEFKGRSDANVHDWKVSWTQSPELLKPGAKATLTIQLAAAKTESGNLHEKEPGKGWADLPLTVLVNNQTLRPWMIPTEKSSSCASRSGISCYYLDNQWKFDAGLLRSGENEMILRLPPRMRSREVAKLPEMVYVQYDALRLEIG